MVEKSSITISFWPWACKRTLRLLKDLKMLGDILNTLFSHAKITTHGDPFYTNILAGTITSSVVMLTIAFHLTHSEEK